MTNSNTLHYYIAHSSFKDRNSGNDFDLSVNSDLTLASNVITKAILSNIKESILTKIIAENPHMNVYDYRLNSFSYLGEMTEEEYNS
ncbi:hypothetical protein B9X75_10595 [Acinetobacter pittii]|uniref:hypothetical protein n=1 Tax=Acinetobacter pittii TaxID=48296 RepID=UPI00083891F2|nr:hypothetical protein [Acinetobacter pittii]MCK0901038.1 hypothetical protein [Acinetobacter pittii]OCY98982.1 hypothetical protein BFR94_03695 [Acinetobacter pittii]OTL33801.1 hypothetical protein B9X75_10595 [Acinetobacter pittii]OTM18242.1 hypothetical protein B9X53_06730 [Acinetobacter pittii]WQD15438.1 hypothetical protein U0544_18030 [Acinetobacter pittii]